MILKVTFNLDDAIHFNLFSAHKIVKSIWREMFNVTKCQSSCDNDNMTRPRPVALKPFRCAAPRVYIASLPPPPPKKISDVKHFKTYLN